MAMTIYAALAVMTTSGEETATTSSTAGRATTSWRATRFTKRTLTSSTGATAMIPSGEARALTSSTVGMATMTSGKVVAYTRTSILTSSIVAKARTKYIALALGRTGIIYLTHGRVWRILYL